MAVQLNMQMGVDDEMKLYKNQHSYVCLRNACWNPCLRKRANGATACVA
jgi:hypothetical protein